MIYQITPGKGENAIATDILNPGLTIIRPIGYKSMAEALNAGIESARNTQSIVGLDWFVFQHDDAEVLLPYEVSLETILNSFSLVVESPGVVGCIGCKTLTIDGRWWLDNDRFGEIIQNDGNEPTMVLRHINDAEPAASVDGCFMAVRAEALGKVGLFDENFTGWHYYDADLCTRAAKCGYTNLVAPLLVRHKSGGQLNEDWFKSRDYFAKKWEGKLYGALVN